MSADRFAHSRRADQRRRLRAGRDPEDLDEAAWRRASLPPAEEDPEPVDPAWYAAAVDEAEGLDPEPTIYRALDHGQDPDYGGTFDGFTVTSDADPGL